MHHPSTASSSIGMTPLRPQRAHPPLTTRELAVLTLVVDGMTNPQIAARLSNSPRTVQSHVRALMRKFDVATRTQLAVHALRARVVPLEPSASVDPCGPIVPADHRRPSGTDDPRGLAPRPGTLALRI